MKNIEIVNHEVPHGYFHHVVDVENEEKFVAEELGSKFDNQEQLKNFITSLKNVRIWPCRFQHILDMAKTKGIPTGDQVDLLNLIWTDCHAIDEPTCIGKTQEYAFLIGENLTNTYIIGEWNGQAYKIKSRCNIPSMFMTHCVADGETFTIEKV